MRVLVALLLGLTAMLLVGRESAAWHVGPSIVTDGDTLKIGKLRFRLKGVAAPERDTPAGARAREFVLSHFGGQWIACHETGELSLNRYEAFCYTLTGNDIGAAIIRAGLACAASKARWRVPDYVLLQRPDHPMDCGYGT
jgi:endonuclease YncB( thermonuclease family)